VTVLWAKCAAYAMRRILNLISAQSTVNASMLRTDDVFRVDLFPTAKSAAESSEYRGAQARALFFDRALSLEIRTNGGEHERCARKISAKRRS